VSARQFTLRPLAPGDLPAVTDLWVAAWRGAGLAIDFDARRNWFEMHLAELASGGAEIVVAQDARHALAGLVTINPASGHLDQLCVAPEQQGSGLARLLLDAAKSRAPRGVRLEVNVDNSRACRFYRREGFVEIGKGNSNASGLPILIMEWRADASLQPQR
jgi:putative acetyltransferase